MAYAITDKDIGMAQRYVRFVCRKYGVRRWQDVEECEGRAMCALVMAAGRYRGDRGASFRTYVSRRLWGSVIDYLRKLKSQSVEISETDLILQQIQLHPGSKEYVTLDGLERTPGLGRRTAYRGSRAGKCKPS